jgi:hypothetical protein
VTGHRMEGRACVCRHKELLQLGAGELLLADFLKPRIVLWDDVVSFAIKVLSSLLRIYLSFTVRALLVRVLQIIEA